MPKTRKNWEKITAGFDRLWNFPKCLGVMENISPCKPQKTVEANILTIKNFSVLYCLLYKTQIIKLCYYITC